MIYIITFLISASFSFNAIAADGAPAGTASPAQDELYMDSDILDVPNPSPEKQAVDPLVSEGEETLDLEEGLPADNASIDKEVAKYNESYNKEKAASATYTPFDGINFETLNNSISSMLYSSEQVDLLYSKIRKFKLSGSDLTSIAGGETEAVTGEDGEPQYTFVTYFLASILYPSDGEWTIWLNGEKIRKEQALENAAQVEVKSINDNYGVFIYKTKPQQLTVNAPTLKTTLKRITPEDDISDNAYNWDFISEDKNIKVASIEGVVEFKLKMSQTFSLYDMQIKEGKYAPAGAAPVASADQSADELLGATGQGEDVVDTMLQPQSIDALNKEDVTKPVEKTKEEKAPEEQKPSSQLKDINSVNDSISKIEKYDFTATTEYKELLTKYPSLADQAKAYSDGQKELAKKAVDELSIFKSRLQVDIASAGTDNKKSGVYASYTPEYQKIIKDFNESSKKNLAKFIADSMGKTEDKK